MVQLPDMRSVSQLLQRHKPALSALCASLFLFFFVQVFAVSDEKVIDQPLSKKAFATELALRLNVSNQKKTTQCYKDLSLKDGATKHICSLKKEGVFPPATKFSPNANLTWGTALESVCRAKNWSKKNTFASCLAYAKKLRLIPSGPSRSLQKKTNITRAELDDFFRLTFESRLTSTSETKNKHAAQDEIAPQSENLNADDQETQPKEKSTPKAPELPTETRPFTPFPEQQIATLSFANFQLTAPFSNHFYVNEVYVLEGDIISGTSEEVFVFVCPDGEGCTKSKNFLEKTTDGRHFKIPVFFEETGNFQLGLISGRSGQSRVENISVIGEPTLPSTPPLKPEHLSVRSGKNGAKFSWEGSGYLARLVIYQDSKRKDYIFRQATKTFSPPSKDFGAWHKGDAWWFIEIDGSRSPAKHITLTTQDFREIKETDVMVTSLQEVFENPGTLRFNGKALKPVSKKAAVTLPNGQVQELHLGTKDIPTGDAVEIEVALKSEGTYIFEVNNPAGAAVVNVPIYVGDYIPLLPDFFTSNPATLSTTPIDSIKTERATMLALINSDRKANGLEPVQLFDTLNSVAQKHSQDMNDRNFFGHNNPDGETPDDRRKKGNYLVGIRENLGKASSLEHVQAGLMRSPIHRAAIIDPNMKRVGIGIVKSIEGYYLVTQNYSGLPLTASDALALEGTLYTKVQEYRAGKSVGTIAHDPALREISTAWSAQMAEGSFFATIDSEGNSVAKLVRAGGNGAALRIHIVKSNTHVGIEEELFKQTGLEDSSFVSIGIGVAVNQSSDIYMTVIYSK